MAVSRCALAARLLLACLVALVSVDTALAQAPTPRFPIQQFIIEGNTLLTQQEVDTLVGPFTGPSRDFGDIQEALEALQNAYAERGYTAVRVLVPEQDIRAGQVRLQVVESRIRQVRVEGNRFFDSANIRNSIRSLQEGASPNTRRIGLDVLLANENPAKQANVLLEATNEPAQVDAVVRVTDEDPTRYTVFLDNSGNSQTGYYRVGAGFQHANVAGLDHVLNAQLITSPDHVSDVAIYGVGYRIPFYGWRGALDVVAGYSDVNSGTLQNLFAVSGKGSIFGVRYTHTLPRVGIYEQKLAAGWDYRAFKQDVVLIGTTGTLVPDLTVKPVSLTYSGRVSQVGRDASVFASYSQNIPGGADGDQAAFTAQRAGADAKYSIFRYGASVSQLLPMDYLVRAEFTAQHTNDLLFSGEQFGMGGFNSVRGYLPRENSNDVGHRFSLEAYSPDFGSRLAENWRARVLAFVDVARGYDRLPARGPESGLASAGLGARLNYGKALSVRVDWGHVLNASGTRDRGKDRVDFSVAYTF